ncbi:MAG: SOS response-associated peptidase [Albidovulum sp.]
MCGRFILGESNWAQYHDALSIISSVSGEVSFNIKPTQTVSFAHLRDGSLSAGHARWWFVPHWHRGDVKEWKATTFNAKIETAFEKPTFRAAWTSGRCIVPASGYYEWTGPKAAKQPWFIAPQSNLPVFFFAGLYSTLNDGQCTCTILTRNASEDLQHLHPRMPVMLNSSELLSWLNRSESDQTAIESLGTSWAGNIIATPVRPFGIHDDGPELIETDGLDV